MTRSDIILARTEPVMHPLLKLGMTGAIITSAFYCWSKMPHSWPEKPQVVMPEIRYITVTNYVTLPRMESEPKQQMSALWVTNFTWFTATNNYVWYSTNK